MRRKFEREKVVLEKRHLCLIEDIQREIDEMLKCERKWIVCQDERLERRLIELDSAVDVLGEIGQREYARIGTPIAVGAR